VRRRAAVRRRAGVRRRAARARPARAGPGGKGTSRASRTGMRAGTCQPRN